MDEFVHPTGRHLQLVTSRDDVARGFRSLGPASGVPAATVRHSPSASVPFSNWNGHVDRAEPERCRQFPMPVAGQALGRPDEAGLAVGHGQRVRLGRQQGVGHGTEQVPHQFQDVMDRGLRPGWIGRVAKPSEERSSCWFPGARVPRCHRGRPVLVQGPARQRSENRVTPLSGTQLCRPPREEVVRPSRSRGLGRRAFLGERHAPQRRTLPVP